MPHVMDSAGPLDVIQGKSEIVILTENAERLIPRFAAASARGA